MTTTTCTGAGTRTVSNARSRTTMPCPVCHTYHAKVEPAAPRELGRSVTEIEAELARPGHESLAVIKNPTTGVEATIKMPVPYWQSKKEK